jgi:hypothetical protein
MGFPERDGVGHRDAGKPMRRYYAEWDPTTLVVTISDIDNPDEPDIRVAASDLTCARLRVAEQGWLWNPGDSYARPYGGRCYPAGFADAADVFAPQVTGLETFVDG